MPDVPEENEIVDSEIAEVEVVEDAVVEDPIVDAAILEIDALADNPLPPHYRVYLPIDEGNSEVVLHQEAETIEDLEIPDTAHHIELVSGGVSQVVSVSEPS
jgi:hypothetical protein